MKTIARDLIPLIDKFRLHKKTIYVIYVIYVVFQKVTLFTSTITFPNVNRFK